MNLSHTGILKFYRNRRIRYSIAGILVLAGIVIFFVLSGSKADEENWAEVVKGNFTIDLVESGEIRAVESVYVAAPREWRMDLQIIDMISEGTIVKKGDFLVQFDTSTLDEELNTAMDNLKQAEADLKSVETQQASRRSELEINRQIAVYSKEAAELKVELLKYESENKQEEARLDLQKELIRFEEAEKKIETQKIIDAAERQKAVLKLEQARGNVEQIKRRIDQLTLRAPISGMVVYLEIGGWNAPRYKASIGDNVQAGEAVISIPDLSKMKMVVRVNEMDADKLMDGDKVVLRLDAFEGAVYHGTVTSVSSLVEKNGRSWQTVKKAPSFEVTIFIDETSELLKPGMTAQATVILEEIPGVLSVPIGAVYELEDGSPVVYTRRRFPDPVPVKPGKRNDRFIIIEEGLREGNKISLNPPTDTSHPLGWFAEMERRRTEFQELLAHIETMNELGLTYDPAKKDSTQQKINQQSPPRVD